MAIRTQIRLPQITGSLGTGTGQINDQINGGASAATGSIDNGDLSETLSYMAAAIKRVHGADSFSEATEGDFHHAISFNSSVANPTIESNGTNAALRLLSDGTGGIVLGGGTDAKRIKIDTTTDDEVAIRPLGSADDKDLVFGTTNGGSLAEVFRVDGSANSLLVADTAPLAIGSSNVTITNSGTGASDSKLILSASSTAADAVKIDTNLTLSGDLTVNGTTTTVNSTNLTVDDAIILLGQGNSANTKDLGFVLERGGSNIALFLDETDDVFKFQFTAEDASDDEITAAAGKLSVQVDKLQFTGSNHYIEAVDLGGGSVDLTMNSSKNLVLIGNDATTTKIQFGGTVTQTNTIGMSIDLSTDRNAQFLDDGGNIHMVIDGENVLTKFNQTVRMDTNKSIEFRDSDAILASATTAGELVYSGSSSLIIANTTTADSGLLKIQKDAAFVGFDFDGDTSVTYSWPNAPAANNYVLQAQTDGSLSWAAQGGAGNSVKTYATVEATISSNANLSSDNGYSTTDYSAISTANASKALDVYVNGQLLQSGSGPYATDVSDAGFTSGDYLADTLNMSTLDVKFAFDLEIDDVVCIIGRA